MAELGTAFGIQPQAPHQWQVAYTMNERSGILLGKTIKFVFYASVEFLVFLIQVVIDAIKYTREIFGIVESVPDTRTKIDFHSPSIVDV